MKLSVDLEFEFDGDVTPNAIVENIANHLMHDIGSAGIVGDDDEGFTKSFTVAGGDLLLKVDMYKHSIETL